MARKKIPLPKLTGKLNELIVGPPVNIAIRDEAGWKAALKARDSAVDTERARKLPELARQLGWVINCDLHTLRGRHDFFCSMSIGLATLLGIRGFQVAKPKWRPEFVLLALWFCDNDKAKHKSKSDYLTCLEIVKKLDPDLNRRDNSRAAKAKAVQLRNRVSALRSRFRRQAREAERKRAENERPVSIH